jgi:GxxExxY protein
MNTDAKRARVIEGQSESPASYPQQELTGKILEAAFGVHNVLGAGFLERVYSNALSVELRAKGLKCMQEAPLKVNYKGTIVGDYAADMVVEDAVLIELKACTALDPNHRAQIINYLRASGIHVGLLINFDRPRLEYERFVY